MMTIKYKVNKSCYTEIGDNLALHVMRYKGKFSASVLDRVNLSITRSKDYVTLAALNKYFLSKYDVTVVA